MVVGLKIVGFLMIVGCFEIYFLLIFVIILEIWLRFVWINKGILIWVCILLWDLLLIIVILWLGMKCKVLLKLWICVVCILILVIVFDIVLILIILLILNWFFSRIKKLLIIFDKKFWVLSLIVILVILVLVNKLEIGMFNIFKI